MDKFIKVLKDYKAQKEMESHQNKIPKEKMTTKLNLTNNRKRPAVDTTNSFTKAAKLNNSTVKESNFTYLPIPKTVKFQNKENELNNSHIKDEEKKDSSTTKNVMQQQTGRNMQLISGRVKFIIKVHKEFPDLNAIYEVYGKIIKIIRQDYPREHVLILRDTNGPVLHAIYYEVNINCSYLQEGNYICVIGRFTANNKLHIFKMRPLLNLPNDEVFNRLQNICNFTLNNIKQRES